MRLFSCFAVPFTFTFELSNTDNVEVVNVDDYKSDICFAVSDATLVLLVATSFLESGNEVRLRELGSSVNMRRCNSSGIF